MAKQIAISGDAVKLLDKVRKQEGGISYSKAIMKMSCNSPDDLALNEINRRFYELEDLMPDLQETWEILRIVAVYVRRLPMDVKHAHIEMLNNDLREITSRITELKEEVK